MGTYVDGKLLYFLNLVFRKRPKRHFQAWAQAVRASTSLFSCSCSSFTILRFSILRFSRFFDFQTSSTFKLLPLSNFFDFQTFYLDIQTVVNKQWWFSSVGCWMWSKKSWFSSNFELSFCNGSKIPSSWLDQLAEAWTDQVHPLATWTTADDQC